MKNETALGSNAELKAMLEALHLHDDKDLEQKAFDEIANRARFLAAVHPAKGSRPEEQKYDFPVLTSGNGNLVYPLFTDAEELKKWEAEKAAAVLAVDFDGCAEMLEQDSRAFGLVIDPYGVNFTLDRDTVHYLQVQKAFLGKLAIEQLFHEQQDGGPVVRDPEPYPTELARALSEYMATNEHIRRAWLREMENEGETSYLVVIDAENAESNGDFGAVSGAAMPHLQGRSLDLIALDDPFARKAVEGAAAFYTQE